MKNLTKIKNVAFICLGFASIGSYKIDINAEYDIINTEVAQMNNNKDFNIEPIIQTQSQSETDQVNITYTRQDYMPLSNTGIISCDQSNEYFSLSNGCACLIAYEEDSNGQCIPQSKKEEIQPVEAFMMTRSFEEQMMPKARMVDVPQVASEDTTSEYSIEYAEEPVFYNEPPQEVSYGSGQSIVDKALSLVGSTGYDCFSVVKEALANSGWYGDYASGQQVSLDALIPGDVIVYPSHYSVYVGDGQAVHGGYNGSNVILGNIIVGKQPYTAYRCF